MQTIYLAPREFHLDIFIIDEYVLANDYSDIILMMQILLIFLFLIL